MNVASVNVTATNHGLTAGLADGITGFSQIQRTVHDAGTFLRASEHDAAGSLRPLQILASAFRLRHLVKLQVVTHRGMLAGPAGLRMFPVLSTKSNPL